MIIKDKINEKLNEKKQYVYTLKKDVIFNIGIMTAIGILGDDSRELMSCGNKYVVFRLYMDKAQKTAIDLTVKDYLRSIKDITEVAEKPASASRVWK